MSAVPTKRPIWLRVYLELRRTIKHAARKRIRTQKKIARDRLMRQRIRAARKAYKASHSASVTDSFLLVRIIGNDLEPRHRKGQSYDNVRFILDNEPAFPGCEKFWIVNRIVDADEEARIVELLRSRGQALHQIPFELDAYRRVSWNTDRLTAGETRFSNGEKWPEGRDPGRYETHLRLNKNRYAMNNNGARNAALRLARAKARWLMPWDGNCYLTRQAFDAIRVAVAAKPYLSFVIVPMARIVDNAALLDGNFRPKAREEPQIVFRSDTTELFDETLGYGRRPKVEMLWRLGVPGPWDKFRDDGWDQPRPPLAASGGLFQKAGWVARLESGYSHLEIGKGGSRARMANRDEAIVAMLDRCDAKAVASQLDPSRLTYYDEDALAAARDHARPDDLEALRDAAEQALSRIPASVMDKTGRAPSGDPHDYVSPAPYWWPDPDKADGLPYIRRDGRIVPGAELNSPGSEAFDRTRLQRVLDDTTVLALAATVLGDRRFADRAAGLIRTWFVDPATRMAPHLRYAQVRSGHNGDEGQGYGIIELKDLYFFLDAVRLIERAGALNQTDREAFRSWLSSYAQWLDTAPAGRFAFHRPNNHGVFFDLQRAAIAAFLGDGATLAKTGLYARERLIEQIAADGSLPRELTRARPRHYVVFSLQGWTSLARLLSSIDDDLWGFKAGAGQGLPQALSWLAAHLDTLGSDEARQSEPVRPLLEDLARHGPKDVSPQAMEAAANTPMFHPDHAIAPFWIWRRP